jgi:hypothetical protein
VPFGLYVFAMFQSRNVDDHMPAAGVEEALPFGDIASDVVIDQFRLLMVGRTASPTGLKTLRRRFGGRPSCGAKALASDGDFRSGTA